MEHLSLLAGGQEHSTAEWEKAAADVLRKSGRMSAEDPDALVWEKLTRTTLDGIEVAPLGTPDTVADLPPTGAPGAAPYVRGTALSRPEEGWDIRANLADPDAARSAADAVTDLENGATSLWLSVGRGGIAVDDLPVVLEKVYVDLAPVVLSAPSEPLAAAQALVDVIRDRGVEPAPGTNLGADPVGDLVRGASETLAGARTSTTGQRDEDLVAVARLALEAGSERVDRGGDRPSVVGARLADHVHLGHAGSGRLRVPAVGL